MNCKLALLIALLPIASMADYINVNTGVVRVRLPDWVGATYRPSWEQYKADGWRVYQPCASIAGSNIATRVRSDDGNTVVESCTYTNEPPRPVEVDRFDVVQANMIVLEVDGKGVGYVAASDLTLIPIAYAHESPYPSKAELDQRAIAAIAKHNASKAVRSNELARIKAASASANSVPALRAEVARIAELLESMSK